VPALSDQNPDAEESLLKDVEGTSATRSANVTNNSKRVSARGSMAWAKV
jgi:hypothetical protein